MRMRGPKPKPQNLTWRPELAYAVGLFAADGCMYNDGRHFSFVSEDRELIKKFMQCLNLKNKIGEKISGYSGKKCPHVQWGSVVMYEFFLSLGFHGGKSVYQLRYAKAEAFKIIKKMYYSPTVVCLERKKRKIEKALTIDANLIKRRASGGT